MKIVIVIGQLGIGGGERQLYLLLSGLNRTEFQPVVLSFNPGVKDYWEEPIKALGVPLFFVPRESFVVKRLWNLFKFLRSQKPELVVSWTLHLNFAVGILGRLAGAPRTIGSVRNDLFNPMKKDRPLHRFFGTKGPHHFISNSSQGQRDMVEKLGISRKQVSVVFNAVEVLPNRGIEKSREDLRMEWGIPHQAFCMVAVGRLEASKNQEMLIRVLGRLVPTHKEAMVAFMGEGPAADTLRTMAIDMGLKDQVKFLGKVPMAVKYLHAFDMFAHTGLADGMPNVLLEASVRSLPVVTTRVNGAEDIVVHGETGYIVNYNDDQGFAEAVERLIDQPALRRTFGEQASARVLSSLFSKEGMVSSFERIFLKDH